jgi:hypothetical protein
MYVCIYIYIYIFTYTYAHTHTHTHTHTCTCTQQKADRFVRFFVHQIESGMRASPNYPNTCFNIIVDRESHNNVYFAYTYVCADVYVYT